MNREVSLDDKFYCWELEAPFTKSYDYDSLIYPSVDKLLKDINWLIELWKITDEELENYEGYFKIQKKILCREDLESILNRDLDKCISAEELEFKRV